jgi:hypothetical protein
MNARPAKAAISPASVSVERTGSTKPRPTRSAALGPLRDARR